MFAFDLLKIIGVDEADELSFGSLLLDLCGYRKLLIFFRKWWLLYLLLVNTIFVVFLNQWWSIRSHGFVHLRLLSRHEFRGLMFGFLRHLNIFIETRISWASSLWVEATLV